MEPTEYQPGVRRWTYLMLSKGMHGTYAFGDTVEDVKATYRECGGRLNQPYTIYEFPENAINPYVTKMGGVGWEWDETTPEEDKAIAYALTIVEQRPKEKSK